MIKGDSLAEKVFFLAKKAAFVNGQERELMKRAARRIQTLEAENFMLKERLAKAEQVAMPAEPSEAKKDGPIDWDDMWPIGGGA